MPYLDLPGGRTYHEVAGAGEPIVLLHGGFASLEVMRELNDLLVNGFEVHGPERPGHGRTSDAPGPYTFAAMVEHTLAYLDAMAVPRAHVVGFSDGAITGLLLARDHPERVASLVAISANLDPSGFVPAEEAGLTMTAAQHQLLDEEYAALSPDGAAHADEVVRKLMALWTTQPQIPPTSLATIAAPTLVLAGERDMVRLEHTRTIAGSIPGARLEIIPGTGHLLVRERPDLIAPVVLQFLQRVAQGQTGPGVVG
jgi:pimeloyl-ACP methyl ester carboxylesterase